MRLTKLEIEAKKYYDILWSDPDRIRKLKKELLSWHFGFYEKGINNSKEAKINMMDYVGRLLELDDESSMKILDAGSGVGTTSINLAKKYTNCVFHGITISYYESLLSGKLQKKYKINNVRFQQGSYMQTSYKNKSFDRIFALESVIYSPDKKEFIKEIYRILKPKGKIVILDIFPKKHSLEQLTIKIDNYLYGRNKYSMINNKFYVDINQFIEYLKSEKFSKVKVCDLIKSGNIKKKELIISIILSSLALLISRVRFINNKKSLKNKLISPFLIFIFISYKFLISLNIYNYYSIEAKKY